MAVIRERLRQWLGIAKHSEYIKTLQDRERLAWERIVAFEQQHSEISKKQAHLDAVLLEVRQLREMLADPKRQPIATRTASQFRRLMETE